MVFLKASGKNQIKKDGITFWKATLRLVLFIVELNTEESPNLCQRHLIRWRVIGRIITTPTSGKVRKKILSTNGRNSNGDSIKFEVKKNEIIKRGIITPDKHFPLEDKAAIKCLIKAIEIVRPDTYVDLGDVGEWSAFSHWKFARIKKPPLEYLIEDFDKDVNAVNKGMDTIDEALDKVGCKDKYFTEGNHDNWCNMAVDKYPYIPQYKFSNAVKLKERGYKFYKFGKHLKIGKLYFYHGHQYGGIYHAANHLRKLGCNIMYAHWHSLQHMTATHMDGAKAAWSIGCLKDMNPSKNDWLNNRRINWGHAFAVVDWFKGGNFCVNVVQIVNGKASLWGEVIDGN